MSSTQHRDRPRPASADAVPPAYVRSRVEDVVAGAAPAGQCRQVPREKWLEDFDFDANPTVNRATIHTLALIIEAGTRSYRLAQAKAQRAGS